MVEFDFSLSYKGTPDIDGALMYLYKHVHIILVACDHVTSMTCSYGMQ